MNNNYDELIEKYRNLNEYIIPTLEGALESAKEFQDNLETINDKSELLELELENESIDNYIFDIERKVDYFKSLRKSIDREIDELGLNE